MYKAIDKRDGRVVAVKEINLEGMDESNMAAITLEAGLALFSQTLFCTASTIQLMTASVTDRVTPGSDNPGKAYFKTRLN